MRYTTYLLSLVVLFLSARALWPLDEARAQAVPTDAKPTCIVEPTEFKTWFNSGTVSLDGTVKPADSVNFTDTPNCSFYQWSEQMFLWLSSPTGGAGRVFQSPAFFDVSPLDGNNRRNFIPHSTSPSPSLATIRTPQDGPNDLPVVMSTTGQLFEVVTPPSGPEGKPLVQDSDGNVSEVARVEVDAGNAKPTLFGTDGEEIDAFPDPPAETLAPAESPEIAIARKLSDGANEVLVDAAGNIIQTEIGQARTGGVLISQKGSLVYYVTTVNDAFAYMVTGGANGGISPAPTQFPVTQAEMDRIVAFAAAHQKTIAAPEALALELKTSWVEASSVADPSKFITMDATVPTFDTSDPAKWKPNGQKTVELAMVGMHVVGSTKDHPEMIWATFEHVDNVPVGGYSYFDTAGNTKTVAQPTSGPWLFSADNPATAFNAQTAQFDSGNIIPADGSTGIAPSNTIRWKTWGKVSDTNSNTEVVAINNSVLSQLADGDVRANYILVGATWTIGGAAPNGTNQVGTNMLANSTMETYLQGTSNSDMGSNCFPCHRTNQVGVSHVYRALNPLF